MDPLDGLRGKLDELLSVARTEQPAEGASARGSGSREVGQLELIELVAQLMDSFDSGRDAVFPLLVEMSCHVTGAASGTLYLGERQEIAGVQELRLAASWLSKASSRPPKVPDRLVAFQVRRILADPLRHGAVLLWEPSQLRHHQPERRLGSSPPRLLGLLQFRHKNGAVYDFDESAGRLSAMLGESVLRGERVYREATTDPLTGLFSRWHLDPLLQREIRRARVGPQPLALLMLDLDRFKAINDQWGHPAGDGVVRSFGAMLRLTLRKTDLAVRYGGDEFAILLPTTDLLGAEIIAEKIRLRAGQVEVPRGCEALTVSIGCSELGASSSTPEELIACADRALYQAKAHGRNQVALFDPTSPDTTRRIDELAGVFTGNPARDHRNFSLLLRVNRALTQIETVDELLAIVLDAALEVTGGERGIILLLDEPQDALSRAIRRGLSDGLRPGISVPSLKEKQQAKHSYRYRLARARGGRTLEWVDGFSRSIPRKVFADGEPVFLILQDGQNIDESFETPSSVQDLNLRSVLCAPLEAGGSILGALYVDSHSTTYHFTEADFAFFQALAGHAAVVIYQASLVERLEEAHRELQDLDRRKSDFLSIASHELKTPLTVLLGYLDLMRSRRMGELPREQERAMDVMFRETQRLVALTQDLLTLSRVGMDQIPLRYSLFEMAPLITDVIEDVRPFAEERQFQLQWTPPEEPILVNAEAEALRTVMQNLLQNAIRFTPDGGRIQVRLNPLEADELSYFRVEVQDNGIGIATEDLPKVFERFRVLQNTDHHFSGTYGFRAGGMGIGLSIARGIVKAHGGCLDLESKLGEGSTFWFELPRAKPEAQTSHDQR